MRFLLALLLPAALSLPAHAQDAYPSRQITLIAPYAAGGSTDLVARVLSEGLKVRLGQPIVIDNKPGGNGVIGTREVVKAAPDGYTLLIGAAGAQVIPAAMVANYPFDLLRDFTPVARTAEWAAVMMVKKDLPVTSLRELVTYARARPGQLNFGSSGYGSLVHLVAEVFMKETGIAMQHVPYKGGGNSITDLMSGSLDVLFTSSPVAVGQVANPNLKMLAVARRERLKLLPEVPTFAQAGVAGVDQTSWMCVLGPAGLPAAIRDKLSAALVATVNDPATQARLQAIGFEAAPADAAAFDVFFRGEVKRWAAFVKERGLMEKP
jgi:tripartite-type tricarboxylate transporter receptor subunit TctC